MAMHEKEPTKTTAESGPKATAKSERHTHHLGSPLVVGIAVGAGILLLLGGTAAGFFASRVLGPNHSFGRFGMMDTDDRMGGAIRSGGMVHGGRGGMFGLTYGKVTNVSANSITITDNRSGGSVTFKIDSNTDINNNSGDNAKVSDIKVGDTVSVRPTSATDDTTADTIVINPKTAW